jgi:1-acyl-sn-glycerol-3-phosphate acyltransferase
MERGVWGERLNKAFHFKYNTFMDPLLVAAHLKTEVYFLANASIFATPFTRWLFEKLHMIPIQRKHDTNKQKYDNSQIFQRCFDHLKKQGTILIFPEGTSIRKRQLQELKTGTARIVLGAEAQNNFQLDSKILTIGLNYSKPESFRSEVFINFDEPIIVKDYQKLYEQDPENAVKKLTEDIRLRLEAHTIHTYSEDEDYLAKQIDIVFGEQLNEEFELSKTEQEQEYLMNKNILDAIRYFNEKDPQRVDTFRKKIQKYINSLERLDLQDEVFNKKNKKTKKTLLVESITNFLFFVFTFPLFFWGWFNNFIPYWFPQKVAAYITKITKIEEYTAPVMMLTGTIVFPFFYCLQTFLVYYFLDWFWALCYLLSVAPAGFFALYYATQWYFYRKKWLLWAIFSKRATLVANLLQQRTEIIKDLEQAKKEYLSQA